MVTSGCVRATVEDAFSQDCRVIIPEECVADRAEVPHRVNLLDMEMISGDVVALEHVLEHLRVLNRRSAGSSNVALLDGPPKRR